MKVLSPPLAEANQHAPVANRARPLPAAPFYFLVQKIRDGIKPSRWTFLHYAFMQQVNPQEHAVLRAGLERRWNASPTTPPPGPVFAISTN